MIFAENLTRTYGEYKALRGVTCTILPGEFVAIMGESGSGKTTFLNLLGGLDRADSGKLVVSGEEPMKYNASELAAYRRRNVAMIFQDFSLLPTLTVLENVVLPILLRGQKADQKEALQMLERVGLADKANRLPETLSGGEMQRAAVARALLLSPKVLLADEPTGSLDRRNGREALALLREVNQTFGLTVVMVTHSQLAAQAADRTLFMADGQLSAQPE
ncbi:MAG: ABC transporter ATP-binding protein [Spirochaetia bacterium]|nr:ABC transporter ATP-binding protein [Spirochaetia bacterium]